MVGVIEIVLRGILVLALGAFLAVLIWRVFQLFLRAMGVKPDVPPSPATTPPGMPERDPREGVWIETNWGGLGGGLSGWRVSNALVYLLLVSLLLGCLCLAVVSLGPSTPKKEETPAAANKDTEKKDAGKKETRSEGGAPAAPAESPAAGAAKKDEAKADTKAAAK